MSSTQTADFEKCQTQVDDVIPPLRNLLETAPKGKSSSDKPTIVLDATEFVIPRWDKTKGGKLLYYVQKTTFPTNNDFLTKSVAAFKNAANAWNVVMFGMTFEETTDESAAHFDLRYAEMAQGDGPTKGYTNAMAFFPGDKDPHVYVFKYPLTNPAAKLKNTFIHELGHVIGLRHEFAISGDQFTDAGGVHAKQPEEDKAVQFGVKDPNSIMGYRHKTRDFLQSDKDGTRDFYKLANKAKVGDYPIQDYPPMPYKK